MDWSEDAESFGVGVTIIAILFVLVRPGSRGLQFVHTVAEGLAGVVNAATGGGGWAGSGGVGGSPGPAAPSPQPQPGPGILQRIGDTLRGLGDAALHDAESGIRGIVGWNERLARGILSALGL